MAGQISVTSAGIIVPQASEIKEATQGVFQDAFGSDLSLDDATPQGNLIDGITEQKQLDNAQILYFLNQLNPKTSRGIYQDALGSIYGIQRKAATHSVVNCVCTGLAGTVLNGIDDEMPAMAQSTNGDLFQCLVGGTIPASGSITLQFIALETGKVSVAANSVNKIYNVVAGWDAINNPTEGTIGLDVESGSDFEERRRNSLALNATGSLTSVYSHIFNIPNVTDVFVWENTTSSNVTYRGITLKAHSIYVCQNGASADDLAEAIYNSKSAGCDTNSDSLNPLTCTYTDPITGVQYTYGYYIPTATPIYIQINLAEAISTELEQVIKEALDKEFTGESDLNNPKITIGSTIYASRFYSVIGNLGNSDIILESVKISADGTNWQDVLSFNMNILPTLDIESTSPEYVVFNVGS